MDSNIITAKNIDIDQVNFGNLKVLDNGGRQVYVNYLGRPFMIQTPEMVAPFGLNSWSSEQGQNDGPVKYSIELAFRNLSTRKVEAKFLEILNGFDKKIIEHVFENSASYLKKKFASIEVLEALFTPCIKLPKDKATGEVTDKYPPTFKMSVPFKDGTFGCQAYELDGSMLDMAELERDGSTKGSRITAIMQCTGIWIAGGKFGCKWSIMQMRVKRSDALPPCAFVEDDVIMVDSGDDAKRTLHVQATDAAVVCGGETPHQGLDTDVAIEEEPKPITPPVDDVIVDNLQAGLGEDELAGAKTPSKRKASSIPKKK